MATISIGLSAKLFGSPKADGRRETRPRSHRQRDQRRHRFLRLAVAGLRKKAAALQNFNAQSGTSSAVCATPIRANTLLLSVHLGIKKPVELFLAHRASICRRATDLQLHA
jgi:hypothetical protein